jgi:DNA-binding MarR family transcriptional regulator
VVDETPVPDPASWQVAAWRSFLRAHAAVTRVLGRELEAETSLPLSWYDVLLQLAEAPKHRLRMAQLAENVLLSRSGLTRLVDRLEDEGLVRREPSPGDARGTYTVLTRSGMRRLREAAPIHLAGIQRTWLAHFSEDELRTLADLLGRVAPEQVDDES